VSTTPTVRTTVVVALASPAEVQRLTSMLAAAPDLEVVGQATTGAEAVAHAAAQVPDVVLIGMAMPDADAAYVCTELTERLPGVRTVVVADHDDDRVWATLLAGAVGAVLTADLVEGGPVDPAWAVRRTTRGEALLTPRAAATLLQAAGSAGTGAPTPIERAVLTRLAAGRRSSEIAAEDDVPTRLVDLAAAGALARYREALDEEPRSGGGPAGASPA